MYTLTLADDQGTICATNHANAIDTLCALMDVFPSVDVCSAHYLIAAHGGCTMLISGIWVTISKTLH